MVWMTEKLEETTPPSTRPSPPCMWRRRPRKNSRGRARSRPLTRRSTLALARQTVRCDLLPKPRQTCGATLYSESHSVPSRNDTTEEDLQVSCRLGLTYEGFIAGHRSPETERLSKRRGSAGRPRTKLSAFTNHGLASPLSPRRGN